MPEPASIPRGALLTPQAPPRYEPDPGNNRTSLPCRLAALEAVAFGSDYKAPGGLLGRVQELEAALGLQPDNATKTPIPERIQILETYLI
jgi:hypothetical protein